MSSPSKPKTGDRVRLVKTDDDWTDLKPGALGTVRSVDHAGTVHVDWDSGSSLGLIPKHDEFEVLYHDDDEEG